MIKKVVLLCLCGVATVAQPDDLMSIYQQALYADPDLRAAQFQVELSEAQQAQAGGALLPQISATVNVSYNDRDIKELPTGSDEYKGEQYSVGLTQTLLDVSKVLNWKRTQALSDKSDQDYDQAQQLLMYDVVERYFTVLAEQDNLELILQEMSTTEQQLQQLQRQYEKHIVKITDVYELEAKLDALKADHIEGEARVEIAKQSVMELTGEPVNKLAILRSNIQFIKIPGDIQALTQQALINNPIIKAQDKEIQAADFDLSGQHAKHLPVVDLQLQYYNTDIGFQNNQAPVSSTKVAAINVNIPIFSGGVTYQRAQQAAKQLAISKQKKIGLLRETEKETRDAFLSANASVRRIKASNKALQTAIKAREAMEKGFMYGMQSIGDVLISQAREYSAKRDLLAAKYTYIKNRIRFQRALGVLNNESLQEINQWLENS